MSGITRRQFVSGAAAVVSVGATTPDFLLQAARAAAKPMREKVLVVVQLSGGNDGLNTVVPYRNDVYRAARPELAIAGADVARIDDELGLHPALGDASKLIDDGMLGILQGVGYPNPNRSHFESMDIWHTCRRKDEVRKTGWLGRVLDGLPSESGAAPALHLGREKQPLALAAERLPATSIASIERFRLETPGDGKLETTVSRLADAERPSGGLLSFVQSNTTAALAASARVKAAIGRYKPAATYPETELAGKLNTIARLIDAEFGARIYYVTLDGFDTHANQAAAHAGLLSQWGNAIAAFTRDVAGHGHGKRVLTMTFSEFGRRVAENASGGTDHGAAGPMFFTGSAVRPGLLGEHPDLTRLADGDLRHSIDFRSAYTAVLEDWLAADTESVLGKRYEPVKLFG